MGDSRRFGLHEMLQPYTRRRLLSHVNLIYLMEIRWQINELRNADHPQLDLRRGDVWLTLRHVARFYRNRLIQYVQ